MNSMINRRRRLVLAAALGLPSIAAFSQTERPLRVVASFSILADMTREIAGDVAEVAMLVGPDADPHSYAPSPSDVKRVAAADIVIVNGLRFEGWLERLISASGYKGLIVTATKGLVPRSLGGAPDPHAWQSPLNAELYVQNISAALKTARPAAAAALEQRTREYLLKIEQLDTMARARFGAIAQADRRVVSSHDAFGYFGAAYGIEFVAPQGRSTDSEASAGDVARVIRQLKDQRIHALFVENITDPRLIERIAREAGVKAGGELYSDALSRAGGPADTYLKMMAYNVDTLARAMTQGAQVAASAPR